MEELGAESVLRAGDVRQFVYKLVPRAGFLNASDKACFDLGRLEMAWKVLSLPASLLSLAPLLRAVCVRVARVLAPCPQIPTALSPRQHYAMHLINAAFLVPWRVVRGGRWYNGALVPWRPSGSE